MKRSLSFLKSSDCDEPLVKDLAKYYAVDHEWGLRFKREAIVMKTEKFTVSAPTRADLAGGTLDLWPLYCLFGSSKTINVALNLNAICYFESKPSATQLIEIHNSNGISFSFTDPQLGRSL